MEEILERATSAACAAAEPADESPCLAGGDQLLGVDVRERRDAEGRVADQLREDAAGPEGDERAEDWILYETCEQLGASAEHRLDDHRQADPVRGRAHFAPRRDPAATPPLSVLWAPGTAS